MPKIIEITGSRYGKFLVMGKAPSRGKSSYWFCKCDCGEERSVAYSSLRRGESTSCGCNMVAAIRKANTKHGMSRTAVYGKWAGMISRCYYEKDISYSHYGSRGIIVCDSWRENFENFYADMGECPKGFTLERKNVNLGYCKDNCEWIPAKDQYLNRTDTNYIEYRGVKKPAIVWIREFGITQNAFSGRYARGDRGDRLFRPIGEDRRKRGPNK